MALSLTFALVLSETGEIDTYASLDRAEQEITKLKAERETETATIADAVRDTFDEHPGTTFNMDAVVFGALRRLNVLPAAHKVMKDKILAYIRENADKAAVKDKAGNVVTPAEPKRTRLFSIGKGVGGGVRRWSDVPEEAEAK
jgi:hypothetical protein